MKTLNASIFIMVLTCFSLNAKTTRAYFSDAQQGVCKALIEKEGDLAIYDCATLMAEDAESKLNKRIKEIKEKLKEIDDNKLTKLFLHEQKTWENYKRERCNYVISGTEHGSKAYYFNYSICQGAENYRRIETLEGEPSFP